VRLEARQEGDHIVILVADDGRGMNAERLRAKALEKGLITDEEANTMDERQSYNLVFLPGFSMAKEGVRRVRPRRRHGRGAHQHPEAQRQHRDQVRSWARARPSSSACR
jgi:hypothetical protein